MLGQNRHLISVRGPDCFVHWKKQKTTHITLDTFVNCNLFSLFGTMLAKWLLQLLLLLHNSCNIWFHAWRCNTWKASTIFKNPVYLTNHWLDSRDVVETKTSSKSPRHENLQILPKCFKQFSKQCLHQLRSWHFANCRHFSYLLTVFYILPAHKTDKKYFNFEVVEINKFY